MATNQLEVKIDSKRIKRIARHAIKEFEGQDVADMLRLIARDIEGRATSEDVKLARANWLIRLARAIEGITGA